MNSVYYRTHYDFEVKHETPILNIPNVVFDSFFHLPKLFGETPIAVDLRPTGNARFDEMSHHVFVNHATIVLGVFEHVGAWSYNRHITEEHVDKLR